MNKFEQELRKIFKNSNQISDIKYIGRACYGNLDNNNRIKAEFVTRGIADKYEGIKATIINKNDGIIDTNIILFRDLLGKKQVNNPNFPDGVYPYIWKYGDDVDWYAYHPNKSDYIEISDELNDYASIFSNNMEQELTESQSMQF